jgi:tetratricopeptide (TPR) repeat protein
MFGWSSPKCPVEPDVRAWVDERMCWLVGQFGLEMLTENEIILPVPEHFPAPYNGSKEAVRELFEQVCEYMNVDHETIDLKLYSERRNSRMQLGLQNTTGTVGLYDADKERTIIWLESSNVNDPTSVVATLAHELCHVHLLGGGRITREEPDHEPLTDLAAIFFGMGVFTANSSLRDRAASYGNWSHWSISRTGYLVDAVLGYALALFAFVRDEMSPSWARFLRPDIRSLLGSSLAFLQRTDDDVILQPQAEKYGPIGPYSPELVARLLLRRPGREQAACDAAHASHDAEHSESDDAFTQAVFLMQQRRWDEAIRLLDSVIRDDPSDGEAYQQRAVANLGNGNLRDALADAEQAVKHSPDDPEAYRVRGRAHLELQHYSLAIDDFTVYLQEEDDGNAAAGRTAPVYYMRGLAASRLNELSNAAADLTRAIRRLPSWADAYDARADVYDRLGEFARAQADRIASAELRAE